MKFKGIDCSKWQGSINWQQVKNDGVEFAIIRSGWGKESPSQKDKCFEQNYAGCKSIGIPIGTYHYSYSDSISDATSEAAFCLKNIAGKQFEYPVIFDVEDRTMLALSTRLRTDICKAFCETIEDAGYYAMIYCNLDWYHNKLYGDELAKDYDIWLAQWNVEKPAVNCGLWQKSSTGLISGITGNVDLNEAYKDYPNIMKTKGLNGFNSVAISYKTYEVKKGDTLWGISEKFLGSGSKYKQIMELNSLASDVIFPGQVLKIPD